jgi:hypothetical protein
MTATCTWLVEVPTASLYPPEAEWYPDSPSDVYTTVECGAKVTFDPGGFTCENGHDHRTYGGPDHAEYYDDDELDGMRGRGASVPANARRMNGSPL